MLSNLANLILEIYGALRSKKIGIKSPACLARSMEPMPWHARNGEKLPVTWGWNFLDKMKFGMGTSFINSRFSSARFDDRKGMNLWIAIQTSTEFVVSQLTPMAKKDAANIALSILTYLDSILLRVWSMWKICMSFASWLVTLCTRTKLLLKPLVATWASWVPIASGWSTDSILAQRATGKSNLCTSTRQYRHLRAMRVLAIEGSCVCCNMVRYFHSI